MKKYQSYKYEKIQSDKYEKIPKLQIWKNTAGKSGSANPNISVLLNQRVDHAVVWDARVHLLLQQRIFRIVIFDI